MSHSCLSFPFLLSLRSSTILIDIVLIFSLAALSHAAETPSTAAGPPHQAAEDGNLSIIRSSDQIRALVLLPDGNIVTAGVSDANIKNSFALARYKPNGDLDASFGQKGRVTTLIEDTNVEVVTLALQADGKLLVTGCTANPDVSSPKFILARYNTNGSLDDTFGSHGIVTTLIPFRFFSTVSGSTLQSDNKLIVAISSLSENGDFLLLRYQPDGRLDSSFGSEGIVKGSTGFATAHLALTLDSDGKVMVVGSPRWRASGGLIVVPGSISPQDWCPGEFNDGRVFLARYNIDGSRDADFEHGVIHTIGVNEFRWIAAFAFQPDGKVIIGGDTNCRLAFARYNVDGSLDTSFGENGVARTDKRSFGLSTMTLQPDGKILNAFSSYDDLFLMRHNADGSLDTTFGTVGMVTPAFQDIHDLTIQPDGKIIAAGYVSHDVESDFVVTRYHPDGSIDTNFGVKGLVTTNFALFPHADRCETAVPPFPSFPRGYKGDDPLVQRDEASALLSQPDGKILVAGTAGNALTVSRYTPNGSLDRDFGVDGTMTTRISTHPKYADLASALAFQLDGKILVIGTAHNDMRGRPFLVRLTADGRLDASFGKEGKVIPDVGSIGSIIAVLSDGRILAVGGPNDGWPKNWFLFCFLPDGKLDAAFGVGGIVTVNFENLNAALVQPDGKLVLAGARIAKQTKSRVDYDLILERYSPDGVVDGDFGLQGKVKLDTGNEKIYPSIFALQPNGTIVGGGLVPYYSTQDQNEEYFLVRYNPDGSPDTTFGGEGKVTILRRSLTDMQQDGAGLPLSRYPCSGLCHVAIQDDGGIVVVDRMGRNSTIFRYRSDGSVDTSFGNAGKAALAIGAQSTLANAFTMRQYGKMILAGICTNARNTNTFLARYNADGSVDATFAVNGKVTSHVGVATPSIP